MVARPDHVWLYRRNGFHLVVVLVEQRFVNLVPIRNCRIGKEILNLFLQPVVSIRDITGYKSILISNLLPRVISELTMP